MTSVVGAIKTVTSYRTFTIFNKLFNYLEKAKE